MPARAAVTMSALTRFRPGPPTGCGGPDVAVGSTAGVALRSVGLAATAGVVEGGGVAAGLGDGWAAGVALGGGGVPVARAVTPATTPVGPAPGVRAADRLVVGVLVGGGPPAKNLPRSRCGPCVAA